MITPCLWGKRTLPPLRGCDPRFYQSQPNTTNLFWLLHSRLVLSVKLLSNVVQQSKENIDKPKVQRLEDILKELDAENVEDTEGDEDLELERRMEELLAEEIVGRRFPPVRYSV